MLLYQVVVFTIRRKRYKKSQNHNKSKMSAPTRNEKFELPDESYSMSDIEDCFKCIIKNHKIVTDNLLIRFHVTKIENRITFKIKTWYYIGLLTPEIMKLFGSTKSKITQDEAEKRCLIYKLLK